MKYMTIGLKKRVSLVVLPIDDFTGRIITGSQLRVYTKNENISSIRKPDGYHVFCNLVGSEAEVCLEGPLYQKQILKLPIGRGEPNIYQVRMLPGIGYPLPQESSIVSGVLSPGSSIKLFFPRQKKSCKLLYDYDPGIQAKELSIFRPYEMSLQGRIMCICGKERNMEFFRVSDQKGNVCILEHPLSQPYRKIDTSVYPVFEAFAGEDGSLYLPIGNLAGKETCVCILTDEHGEEKTCEITMEAGRENRITEDVWKEED